jgi:hypothetical protein
VILVTNNKLLKTSLTFDLGWNLKNGFIAMLEFYACLFDGFRSHNNSTARSSTVGSEIMQQAVSDSKLSVQQPSYLVTAECVFPELTWLQHEQLFDE